MISFLFFFSMSPFIARCIVILFAFLWSRKLIILSIDWFFYSLVIIFLGGIMIIFTYTSSLSGIFKFKVPIFKPSLGLILIIIIKRFRRSNILFPLCSQYTIWITYSLIGYGILRIRVILILIVLFIVVKLIGVSEGPLKI